jgi:acyl-coenzyme A thioesterase PaaI-like protein
MTLDSKALGESLIAAVPFARTLGIEITDLDVGDGPGEPAGAVRAVATLADEERLHNHVGGPHAGALFALGETASGAVVMAAFGPHLSLGTPLAVRADIAYAKLARGPVRATATLGRPVAEVIAELGAGGRPEFPVTIEITRADGAVTTTMTVVWTIRPHG